MLCESTSPSGAIDIVGLSRNKALLMSMPHGKGHIIAAGLNVLSPPAPPPPPKIVWNGPAVGTYADTVCPAVGCPANFPYPTKEPGPNRGAICYNSASAAAAGEGPCGSWCTNNVRVGDGCGDNRGRVCAPSNCLSTANVSAVEAACDANAGCTAFNLHASHDGCLLACPPAAHGPPPKSAEQCCGYWATVTPAPAGDGVPEFPEMAWVLDRLVRFAGSKIAVR